MDPKEVCLLQVDLGGADVLLRIPECVGVHLPESEPHDEVKFLGLRLVGGVQLWEQHDSADGGVDRHKRLLPEDVEQHVDLLLSPAEGLVIELLVRQGLGLLVLYREFIDVHDELLHDRQIVLSVHLIK